MKENSKYKLIKHKRKLVPIVFGSIVPIICAVSGTSTSDKNGKSNSNANIPYPYNKKSKFIVTSNMINHDNIFNLLREYLNKTSDEFSSFPLNYADELIRKNRQLHTIHADSKSTHSSFTRHMVDSSLALLDRWEGSPSQSKIDSQKEKTKKLIREFTDKSISKYINDSSELKELEKEYFNNNKDRFYSLAVSATYKPTDKINNEFIGIGHNNKMLYRKWGLYGDISLNIEFKILNDEKKIGLRTRVEDKKIIFLKEWEAKNPTDLTIDLVKNIKNDTLKGFSINIEKMLSDTELSWLKTSNRKESEKLDYLKNIFSNEKKYATENKMVIAIHPNTQDGSTAGTIILKNAANEEFETDLKWKKNSDGTWNLRLTYFANQTKGSGVGGSFYKYTVNELTSQEFYNLKSKVVVTNDDRDDDQEIFDDSDLKKVVIAKKFESKEQADLLKDLSFDISKPHYFNVDIKKIKDDKATSSQKFTYREILRKTDDLKSSSKNFIQSVKNTFIKWDPSYQNKNSIVIYNDRIKNAVERNIELEFKWVKNIDNKWSLKLNYVSYEKNESGEDDSIYIYNVKEIKSANDDQKQQADIQEVKAIIQQIKPKKQTDHAINSITQANLNQDSWRNLVDGQAFFDTKGTTLTYTHNGITQDGDLEVTVTIAKPKTNKKEKAKLKIAVSGIDWFAEKSRLKALGKLTIQKTNDIAENTLSKEDLHLGQVQDHGFTYAITHQEITHDGDYIVNVALSKDDQTEIIKRKIAIKGIDAANKHHALQAIKSLNNSSFASIYTAADKAELPSTSSNIDDAKKAKIVESIKSSMTRKNAKTLIKKEMISFEPNNNDGNLVIKIQLKSLNGGEEEIKSITIANFKTFGHIVKKLALKKINELNLGNFSNISFNKNFLASNAQNISSPIKNSIVQLIQNQIDSDSASENIVKNIAKDLIKANLISLEADDINQKLTIKINKGDPSLGGTGSKNIIIEGFENIETYNKKPKIVATNDDNVEDGQVIYSEDAAKVIVVRKMTTKEQVDLLKSINIDNTNKVFKVTFENSLEGKTGAYVLDELKNKDAFANPDTVFITLHSEEAENNGVAYEKNIKNSSDRNIKMQLKWIKNSDNTWNLQLYYDSKENPGGEDDSIYRYNVEQSTESEANKYDALKTIKSLNENSFASIYIAADKVKLPSTPSNIDDTKKAKIVELIKSLMTRENAKALIAKEILSFDASDASGKLTIKINKGHLSLGGAGSKDITINGFENIETYNRKPKIVATNDDQPNTTTGKIKVFSHKNILVTIIASGQDNKIDLLKHITNNKKSIFKIDIDAVKAPHNNKRGAFTLEDLQSRIQEQNFEPYSSTYAIWTENTKNDDVAKEFNLKSSSNRKISAQLKWVKNADETWNLQLVYNSQEDGGGEDDSIYRYKVKSINKTLNYNEKSKVVATNDDNTAENDFKDIYNESDFKNVIISKKSEKGKQVDLLQDLSFGQDEPSYFEVNIKKVINSESTSGDPFTLEDIKNRIFPAGDIEQVKTTYIKWDPSYESQGSVAIYNDTITNAAGRNIKLELKWENANNKWALKLNYVSFDGGPGEDDAIYIYDVKPMKVANEDQKQQANIQEIKTIIQQITAQKKATQTIDAVSTATTLNEDAWKNLVDGQAFFDTKGTTLTYTHNGINQDGDLEVTVNITKAGIDKQEEAKFKVAVSGIDFATEKNRIEQLSRLTITKTNDVAANTLSKEELQLGQASAGSFTYKITHNKITEDGEYEVNVALSKGGKTETIKRKIKINGINAANKQHALQVIKSLNENSLASVYTTADKVKLPSISSNIDDTKKAKIVELIKALMTRENVKALIKKDMIFFEANNDNGDLVIKIQLKSLNGGEEKAKKITITNFITLANAAKELALKTINALNSESFSSVSFNKDALGSNAQNISSSIKNLIVQLIQNQIDSDSTSENTVKNVAKSLIKANLISFDASDANGKLTIKINRSALSLGETSPKDIIIEGFENIETYNRKPKIVATNDDQPNTTTGKIKVFSHKNILVTIIASDQDNKIDLLKHITNNKKSIFKIDIDAVKAPHNNKRGAFTLEDLQSRIQEQNFEPYSSTYAIWTENTKNDDVAKEFNLKSSSNRKISAQLKWVKNADETWNLQLVYNSQEDGGGEDDSIYRYKVKSINKTLNYNEKSKVVATNDDNTAENDFKDIYNESDFKNVIVSKIKGEEEQVELLQDLSFGQNEPSYFEVNIKKVINSENNSGGPFTLEDIKNRIFPAGDIEQVKTTYIKWDPSYESQGSVAIYNDTITNAAGRNIKLELKWENANNKWALKLNYVSFDGGPGEDDAIYIYDVKPMKVANEDQKQQANIQEIKTIIQQITAQKKATQTIDAVSTATTLNEDAWKNLVDGQAFFDTKGTTLTYTHNGINQDGDLEVTVNITKAGTDKQEEAKFKVAVSGINLNKAKSNAKKIISNIKTPQKNIYFKEEELFNKIEAVRKTALEKITKSTTTEEVESFVASSNEGTEVSNLLEAIKNYNDAIYNHKSKVVATNDDNEHENQRISYENNKEIVVLKEFGAKEQVDLLRNISSSNNSKLFYIAIDSVDSKNNFKSGAFDSQDLKSRNSENNFEKLQVIKVELKPDTKNGDIAQTLTLKNSSLRDIVVNLKWIKNNNKWSLKLFYNSQANIQGGVDDSIYRYRYISNLDKNKILETINSAAIDKEVLKLYNNTKKLEKLPGDVVFRKKSEILSLIKSKILGLKNPLVKEIITGDFISFSPNNQEKKLDIIIKTEILGSETNKKISISGFVKESSYYAKKILSEVIKNLQANNLERNKEISTSLNIEVTKSMILNYIQDKIRNYKFADDFKANHKIIQGILFLKSIKVEAQGMISDQWISINKKENNLEVTIKEPQIENGINKSITLSSLMDKETYNEKPKIVATNDDQSNSTADKIKVFSDKNILVTIIDSSQDHKIDLLKHVTNNKKSIFKIDIDAVKAPHNNKRGAFTLEDLQSRIQEQNFKFYSSTYAVWTENTENDDVAKEFKLKSSLNRKISAQLKWVKNADETWNLQLVYNDQEDGNGEDDSIYRYKVKSINKTLNYNEKSKVVATNDDNTVKKDFKDIYDKSDFKNVIVSKIKGEEEQVELLQDLSFDQEESNYFEVNIKKVINSENNSGDPFTLEDIKNRIFPVENIEQVKTTYIKWDPSYKDQRSVDIYNDTITNTAGENIKLKFKWEKNANNKWALKLFYYSQADEWGEEDDSIYIYDVKPMKVANEDQKQQANIQEIKTIIQQIIAQKKATQTIDAVSTATTLNEDAWKNLVDGQAFFDTRGTTLTYTHNGINQDGDLEVTVNITKAGTDKQEEAKFKVAVSGIDFATEKNRIEQLSRLTITKTNDVAANTLSKEELQLGQASAGSFTYKITHNKITEDGEYEVNVALSKGGKTETIKRKIKINGINAANKQHALQVIKSLNENSLASVYTTADKVKLPSISSNIDDTKKAKIVELIKALMTRENAKALIKKDMIFFEANNDNGDLVIKIQLKSLNGGEEKAKKITITNFITLANAAKELALKTINALNSESFSSVSFNKDALGSNAQNISSSIKNLIVQLIQNQIDSDSTSENTVKNVAKSLIKANLISFDASDANGKLTIKINRSALSLGETSPKDIIIEGFENIETYNRKPKIVATNDDQPNTTTGKIKVFSHKNILVTIIASDQDNKIDLLKHITNNKKSIFKIDIDAVKAPHNNKRGAFTLEDLQSRIQEQNFEPYSSTYAIWTENTKNDDVAKEFNLKSSSNRKISAQLKWVKNADETWNLQLVYNSQEDGGGEDDSIYRYKVKSINKTLNYNEKSKVVATNDDNTAENDFKDIYNESDFKNVIVSKIKGEEEQVELLQDLSFGQNEPSYFEVNIKKVINSENNSGDPFTLEDIKNRIFPAGNIEQVKTTYIKWDPSYESQGSVAIYNDTITNAVGRNIKLELKWENANNKWALKLNYVSFDGGPGEDDAIYIYDVKPMKVANEDQKQQANIQEIKTIIQQITAQKKATQTIDAVSTATTLNEDAWKNLVDGQAFFDTKGTTLTYTHNGINQDGDLEVTVNITKAGTDKQEEAKFKVAVSGINLNKAKSNAKKIISNIKTPQKNIYFKEEELFNKIEAVRKTALEKITKSTTTEEVESFVASSNEGTEVSNLLEAIKNYNDAIYNHKSKVVATNDDNEHENQRISYENNKEIVVLKEFGAKEQVDLLRNISSSNNSKLFYIAIDSLDSKNNFKSGAFDSQDLKSRNSENNFEKLQVIKVELKPDTKNGDIAQTLTLKNSSLRDIVVNLKWIKNNNKWSLKLFYNSQANIQGGADDSIYRYRYISNLDKNKILETINSAAIDKEVLKLYNNTKKLEKLPGDVVFRKKSEILSLIKSKILGLKNPLVKEIITGDFISFSPNNQEKKLDIIIKTEILGSETNKKISISGFVKESSYYAKKILSEVIKNLQANNLERNKEISTSLNIEVTKSMILNYIQDKIRNYKFADDFKANHKIIQGILFLKSIKVEAQGMISDQWIRINRKENSLEVTIKEPQIENGINKSITLSSLMDKETYNEKPKIVATNDDQSSSTADKIKVFSDKNILVTIIASGQDKKIDLLKHITNNKKSIFKIDIDAVKAPHNNKRGAFTLEDLQSRIQEQNFEPYSSTYAIWTENTKNDDVAKEFNLKSSSNRKISAQLKWALNTDKTWNLQLVYNNQEDDWGEDDSIYRYKVKSINKTLNYNEKSKVVATNDDNTAENDFKDIYNESDFKNVIVSKIKGEEEQVELLQDLSFGQNEPSYFEVNIKKVINSENNSGDPFTLEDIKNRIFPAGNIEQVKTTYIKWDPSYESQGSVAIYNDTITNAVGRNIKLELKWENANNKWALKLNYVSFDGGPGEDDAIYIYDVKPMKVANEDQKQQANIQEIKTIIQQITAQKKATQTIDAVSTATTLNEDAWKNLVDGQAFFDTKGTTLTYTHNGINQDGDLEVTVNITKAGTDKQEEAKFKVAVSGINLNKAKATAKGFINELAYPTQDNANHDAKLFEAIEAAKKAALSAINKATSPANITTLASSKTEGSEVQKVLVAIKAYNGSTGTIVANANAEIDKAIGDATKPTIKDGSAIKTAKDVAVADLIAPTSTETLTFTVSNVVPSTKNSDGTTVTATVTVTSSVKGAKTTGNTYTAEVSGFTSETNKAKNDANAKIDQAVAAKAAPTIKDNDTKKKTAEKVSKDDLIAPSQDGLTFTITKVQKSTQKTDGTTVTATVTVTSSVEGSKTGTYTAEVSWFTSETDKAKNDANAKIDKAVAAKAAPTIRNGSATKTAEGVSEDDLITPSQDGLTFAIAKVEKSTTTTDGTTVTATVTVTSSVEGSKTGTYTAEVSGFTSETDKAKNDANAKIDKAVAAKAAPTIRNGSATKTAEGVSEDDLITPSQDGLTFAIAKVEKSTTTTDGTTVTATVTVTSSVEGSKTGTYTAEVSGFTSETDKAKNDANAKIDQAVVAKAAPTIKDGSAIKTAKDVAVADLIAPTSTETLTFTVSNVVPSTKNSDGTTVTATVTVTSSVKGAKTTGNTYTAEVSGFTSEIDKADGAKVAPNIKDNDTKKKTAQNANAEIDKSAIDKTVKPTIKQTSKTKTAANANKDDFNLIASKDKLKFAITKVQKSTTTVDGTTATVTVTITSSVRGTKTSTYDVEVSGFTSEVDSSTNNKKTTSLSKKQIILISTVSIVGVGAFGLAIYLFLKRRKRKEKEM